MDIIEVLEARQQPIGFARLGTPAGDVLGNLGDRAHRSALAARAQEIGDRTPRFASAADRTQALGTEQFGDVGNDPRRAGLDEAIFVHPGKVALDGDRLLADEEGDFFEEPIGLEVVGAQIGREKVEQEIGLVGHVAPRHSQLSTKVSGTSARK